MPHSWPNSRRRWTNSNEPWRTPVSGLRSLSNTHGDEAAAAGSFRKGMRLLQHLDRRDEISADATAAYYESRGDWKAAAGVRDRQLADLTTKGTLHKISLCISNAAGSWPKRAISFRPTFPRPAKRFLGCVILRGISKSLTERASNNQRRKMKRDFGDFVMNPFGLIIVAAGLFSICGAGFDWDFFINSRKARLFVMLFGRTGARIVYAVLGLFLAVLGVLLTLGILKDAR